MNSHNLRYQQESALTPQKWAGEAEGTGRHRASADNLVASSPLAQRLAKEVVTAERDRVYFWAMNALLVGLLVLLLLTNPASIWTWLPCTTVIAVYILLLRWEGVQFLRGAWASLLLATLLVLCSQGHSGLLNTS